jgi:hypothetical protein
MIPPRAPALRPRAVPSSYCRTKASESAAHAGYGRLRRAKEVFSQ